MEKDFTDENLQEDFIKVLIDALSILNEEFNKTVVTCALCGSPIDLGGECINPDCKNYNSDNGQIIDLPANEQKDVEVERNVSFELGQVVATPGALELQEGLLPDASLETFLIRHAHGDWGDLCESDKAENEFSLKNGFRLFSSYETKAGKLYIITEADRSVTTFLLPEEY